MKRVAMFQSNYIPWKGYFDIIHDVYLFVFYDDVQYTTRDWRNRNYIKPKNGKTCLTVPVVNDNLREKKIYEVQIDTASGWQKKHYKSISLAYAKAPYFKQYSSLLEEIYLDHEWTNLAQMNAYITKRICRELGFEREFINLQDLGIDGAKNGERIIRICRKLGCDYVLNGPAAKPFIDQSLFDESGIVIDYKNYEGYPTYRQMSFPFDHQVSVLDLLFCTGPEAPKYIWGWREHE